MCESSYPGGAVSIPMAFFRHVMAPLDDLPIIHVGSWHMSVLQWTPGGVEVLHRYA